MRTFLYRIIVWLSRIFGTWILAVFAWIVSTGFFLLFPFRVNAGIRFYRLLFPDKPWFFLLGCVWRQFHHFTDIFLDRFMLQEYDDVQYASEGMSGLKQVLQTGSGAILLMSHLGNWEIAAHLLKRNHPGMNLMLYMGVKHKEQIEGMQKTSMAENGVRVMAVDQQGGSPLDIVEGVRFVQTGGVVSLTGDVLWREDQRKVSVKFLGMNILLPETPYLFALLSGVPIFVFFACRTGKKSYRISLSEPIVVNALSRQERPEAIRKAAQRYAALLEETVRRYPFQWYHFKPLSGLTKIRSHQT
jgi:predicted LPLAT superfamily acyltransferase